MTRRSSRSTPHSVSTSCHSMASGSSLPQCYLPMSVRLALCPKCSATTTLDKIEIRVAKGLPLGEVGGIPGDPDSALWARIPDDLAPSIATLAIFGDYVSGGASQPLGRPSRWVVALTPPCVWLGPTPTEWVLCDVRIHALINGYAQGVAFLWSQDGDLLATASQSVPVPLWPGPGRAAGVRA